MRRRDFITVASGAALATIVAGRRAFAQADDGDRVAVVIGVNQAGNLPTLNAASSGAAQVAAWLKTQQFDVRLFVDTDKPVGVHDVKSAVADYVNRGTVTQMVVYFAGHGFVSGYSEFWLLSSAPDDVDEAILLTECVDLARQTGIENVVFISDACRSTADSLGTSRVRGSVVFPNGRPHPNISTDIDRFLATQIGDPAYEVAVTTSTKTYQGLFTTCFLDAFQHPTNDMVLSLHGTKVVPSRRLKAFLLQDMEARASVSAATLQQAPSSIVESDEPTYIGAIAVQQSASAAPPAPAASPPPVDSATTHAAHHALRRATLPRTAGNQAGSVGRDPGLAAAQPRLPATPKSVAFEAAMGFTVVGATVRRVAATGGLEVKILEIGDANGTSLVQVGPGRAGQGTVGLQFSDGSGAVVAALPAYVGHVVVEPVGVVDVSYVPSIRNVRWPRYQAQRETLDELRASVANAAKFGALPETDDLGRQIRDIKGVDPTLDLYAAYSFYQAGNLEQVAAVYLKLRQELEAELFDVTLLADRMASEPRGPDRLVPFCPMLSHGWNLLRVKSVALPPAVAAAREHLRPALWTTFGPAGMTPLMDSDIWS